MKLAKRMSSFAPSATMTVNAKVTELRAIGKDIIGYSAGEPDFDVPDTIKEATINAIREGKNKYTPVGGNDAIKTAIINYMKKEHDLQYSKNEVIVSVGGKHSLYNISQVLFEEGDEVIIFAPYWVSYPDQILLTGAKPVFVVCRGEDDFNPNIDELRKAVTEKTKAIIMNSPNNPSGAVFTDEAVRGIAEVVVENDLILISDEMYDKIVYDDAKPLAPATISNEVKKRTLIVNGFSKTFSMTGWRLGYTLGNSEVISAMTKIQGQATSGPTTPVQYGGVEALKDFSFLKKRVDIFKERRDFIVGFLNSLDGVKCNNPKGAFYVFPDISGWIGKSIDGEVIKDSVTLTELLIDKALIAPVPGVAFGMENHLRFSYALDAVRLKEGMDRLSSFASSLKE